MLPNPTSKHKEINNNISITKYNCILHNKSKEFIILLLTYRVCTRKISNRVILDEFRASPISESMRHGLGVLCSNCDGTNNILLKMA